MSSRLAWVIYSETVSEGDEGGMIVEKKAVGYD